MQCMGSWVQCACPGTAKSLHELVIIVVDIQACSSVFMWKGGNGWCTWRPLRCVQAALAALVGTAGSWAYLRLLINDMDNVSESSVAPFRMAQAQPQGPVRLLLLGFASYRCDSSPETAAFVITWHNLFRDRYGALLRLNRSCQRL